MVVMMMTVRWCWLGDDWLSTVWCYDDDDIDGGECGLRWTDPFSLRAPTAGRKEACSNRLGRKEPGYIRSFTIVVSRSPQAKRTEVEPRRYQQKGTPSRTTSRYSESEDSEGGHWKSKSRRHSSETRMLARKEYMRKVEIREESLKLFQFGRKNRRYGHANLVPHSVQLNPHLIFRSNITRGWDIKHLETVSKATSETLNQHKKISIETMDCETGPPTRYMNGFDEPLPSSHSLLG
ncbi:hypothetical protein Tco_1078681 [Tanacetum coccineum]|uniref:Uncharacterized protein n=1 Tax=Tanacetum coccineum TaxID=301880 RepID=A0ABQ5HPP4_9ASTR